MSKKNIFNKLLIIIALLTISFESSKAQSDSSKSNSKHKIGFVSGVGFQKLLGVDLGHNYKVNQYLAQYYYTLKRNTTWDWEIIVQPQYNASRFKLTDTSKTEIKAFEFGANAGILIRKHIIKNTLSAYAFLSSGPHYVSDVPPRQAKGFIFSDNLFGGLNLKVFKSIFLDLRFGIRHISNANLKSPNGGVNTFAVNGGIVINLP